MEDGQGYTRREWLTVLGSGGAALFLRGCTGKPAHTRLVEAERRLRAVKGSVLPIVQWKLAQPDPSSVLRRKAWPANGLPAGFLNKLERLMRETLRRSGGVGLAAPQVGISRRVALVQLQDGSRQVLACVDPKIVKASSETVPGYEACLSIKGVGGRVHRKSWVEVSYLDSNGRPQVRRSEGWEARIFQHELDHLDGVLYVDRLVGKLLPIEEVRRLRKLEKKRMQDRDSGGRPGGRPAGTDPSGAIRRAYERYLALRDSERRGWML